MQSDRLNPAQTQVKAAYIDVQNKLHKIIRLLADKTAAENSRLLKALAEASTENASVKDKEAPDAAEEIDAAEEARLQSALEEYKAENSALERGIEAERHRAQCMLASLQERLDRSFSSQKEAERQYSVVRAREEHHRRLYQAEERLRKLEEKQKQEMIRMYFALQSCNATLQGRIAELEDSEQKLKASNKELQRNLEYEGERAERWIAHLKDTCAEQHDQLLEEREKREAGEVAHQEAMEEQAERYRLQVAKVQNELDAEHANNQEMSARLSQVGNELEDTKLAKEKLESKLVETQVAKKKLDHKLKESVSTIQVYEEAAGEPQAAKDKVARLERNLAQAQKERQDMLRAKAAQAEDLGRMKTQLLGAISSSKAEVLKLKADKKEVVQRHKEEMGSLQDKLHLQRAMQPPPQAPKQPKTAKKKSQAAQNSSMSSLDAAQAGSSSSPPTTLRVITTSAAAESRHTVDSTGPSVAPPSPDMLARTSRGESDWDLGNTTGKVDGWGEQEWMLASPKKPSRNRVLKKTLSRMRRQQRQT